MQAPYSRGKDEEPQRQLNGMARNEDKRIEIRELIQNERRDVLPFNLETVVSTLRVARRDFQKRHT